MVSVCGGFFFFLYIVMCFASGTEPELKLWIPVLLTGDCSSH